MTPWIRTVSVDGVDCLLAYRNPAGTAKWWGAYAWLSRLPAGCRVTAWSSGGHGCAVALAADRLGLHATVAIPRDADPSRIALLAGTGARVILCRDLDDAYRHALDAPGVPVPGFDDVATVAAHGVLWSDVPAGDTVYVPVGGGGLAASAALHLGGQRIVAVQHAPATSLARSLETGRPTPVHPGDAPVAVRVREVGRVPFEILRTASVTTAEVGPDEVAVALARLRAVGVDAEPAGAVAFAAARAAGAGVALVSGGTPQPEGG